MTPQPPRPPLSSATLRFLWRKYRGHPKTMGRLVLFAEDFIRNTAEPAAVPWFLFGRVLLSYDYRIEKLSVWVVRYIGGTRIWSGHAYGTSADVNYYLRHKNGFSKGWSWDKTDFTPELVNALLAIRTNSGRQVFAWGGSWRTKQDYMHWYIACGPKALKTGINMDSVQYGDASVASPGKEEEMIKLGDKGVQVGKVQDALLDKGYSLPKWGVDEDFGTETAAAVKAFQIVEDLEVTGSVGGVTAAFLLAGGGGSVGPQGPRGPKGDTPDLTGYTLTPG